jgi:hypothetical protein
MWIWLFGDYASFCSCWQEGLDWSSSAEHLPRADT